MGHEIVAVEWIDSSLQNGQVGRVDYPTPELVSSIGWLVDVNERHVTLARDDHKDDEFRGLVCIPAECVRKWYLPERHEGVSVGTTLTQLVGTLA